MRRPQVRPGDAPDHTDGRRGGAPAVLVGSEDELVLIGFGPARSDFL